MTMNSSRPQNTTFTIMNTLELVQKLTLQFTSVLVGPQRKRVLSGAFVGGEYYNVRLSAVQNH